MVKFINQKEQVLEVEMTSYGKSLFSKGEFKPEYYTFFDDGILYDGKYGNLTENQNKIVERIKNATPRLGLWSRHEMAINGPESFEIHNPFDQTTDSNSSYMRFLGSNSPWSDSAPAWKINVIQGSEAALEGPVIYKMNGTIPELASDLKIQYEDVSEEPDNPLYRLEKNENLLLDIQELNTIFKANGNYEVEVFKVSSIPDGTEKLQRLKFINENSFNSDILESQRNRYNLLSTLAGTNREIEINFPKLTNEYVEFYFDVAVDLEIQSDSIIPTSTYYKQRTINLSGDICAVDSLVGGIDAPQADGEG